MKAEKGRGELDGRGYISGTDQLSKQDQDETPDPSTLKYLQGPYFASGVDTTI